ncbi:MAG: AMP-binding protein [Pseudomonadota bacterium]
MSDPQAGLAARDANYVPLSPLSLLKRTAHVYPGRCAIAFGDHRQTWGDTNTRCCALASAIRRRGVGKDDTVAVLAQNTPASVELAFGVPGAGAVLNMINTRLDAAAVAFILDHGEAKVFLIDAAVAELAAEALALAEVKPLIIDIADPAYPEAPASGSISYEDFIASGSAAEPLQMPDDEWDSIALNYTSGTTGNPKGVLYHHRGAYLNALGNGLEWNLTKHPVYLWTLPLFHCNGWCFPWTVAAYAGVNVCLRAPEPKAILRAIQQHQVTHLSGAPIVLNMIVTEAEQTDVAFAPELAMTTAGAAPPAAVLARAANVGVDVTHVYGLTEVYGPTAVCAWQAPWDELPQGEQAVMRARQGVNYLVLEELSVRHSETVEPVPKDGETIGEIMFRGNVVMKGYLKNPSATEEAFAGGHFHSGDLAVWHADGYVEIRDRLKDIIISGGENISSIEVESVLYDHPAVSLAAVVAAPHEKWGETPCAFVELAAGATATEEELIAHCRERLAGFKTPRKFIFGELPKTSTGKVQKFALRDRVKA